MGFSTFVIVVFGQPPLPQPPFPVILYPIPAPIFFLPPPEAPVINRLMLLRHQEWLAKWTSPPGDLYGDGPRPTADHIWTRPDDDKRVDAVLQSLGPIAPDAKPAMERLARAAARNLSPADAFSKMQEAEELAKIVREAMTTASAKITPKDARFREDAAAVIEGLKYVDTRVGEVQLQFQEKAVDQDLLARHRRFVLTAETQVRELGASRQFQDAMTTTELSAADLDALVSKSSAVDLTNLRKEGDDIASGLKLAPFRHPKVAEAQKAIESLLPELAKLQAFYDSLGPAKRAVAAGWMKFSVPNIPTPGIPTSNYPADEFEAEFKKWAGGPVRKVSGAVVVDGVPLRVFIKASRLRNIRADGEISAHWPYVVVDIDQTSCVVQEQYGAANVGVKRLSLNRDQVIPWLGRIAFLPSSDRDVRVKAGELGIRPLEVHGHMAKQELGPGPRPLHFFTPVSSIEVQSVRDPAQVIALLGASGNGPVRLPPSPLDRTCVCIHNMELVDINQAIGFAEKNIGAMTTSDANAAASATRLLTRDDSFSNAVPQHVASTIEKLLNDWATTDERIRQDRKRTVLELLKKERLRFNELLVFPDKYTLRLRRPSANDDDSADWYFVPMQDWEELDERARKGGAN